MVRAARVRRGRRVKALDIRLELGLIGQASIGDQAMAHQIRT
jgi:hypothetical protein